MLRVCVGSLFCGVVLVSFPILLAEEKRAGGFTFTVFLLLSGCLCSVSLPHGTMCWSAVFDWFKLICF